MHKVIGAIAFILSGMTSTALAEQITIAALGDSLTQGYGLLPKDGFVPQMGLWLEGNGVDVALINAGVSGDTTAGGLSRIAWTLTPEVDAVIVALGGNDVLRGIGPEVARANIEGILQAAQSADVEVLLVGIEAPGNYGPDYKAEFEAIYPELSAQFGTMLAPRFFAGLPSTDPAALRPFLQSDNIHPNAQGVQRIVEALGPKVLDLVRAASE